MSKRAKNQLEGFAILKTLQEETGLELNVPEDGKPLLPSQMLSEREMDFLKSVRVGHGFEDDPSDDFLSDAPPIRPTRADVSVLLDEAAARETADTSQDTTPKDTPATPRRIGRPAGRRSDPNYERLTVLVPKDTRKEAERAWEDRGGKDVSELVEMLLRGYVSQTPTLKH